MLNKLEKLNSKAIYTTINTKGYAILQHVVDASKCKECIDAYDQSNLYRTTIDMARYRFGEGEYKYYSYPLPFNIGSYREQLYNLLWPLANRWSKAMKLGIDYPESHADFLNLCHENDQKRPTPLILKYTKGSYNTLHQDLYGDIYFPFQAIVSLSTKDESYTGGELVLTEQRPRAQSKATVLTPGQGDIVIIPTNFRPVQGTKGYYKVNMRHGVAEVRQGVRYTLGIIFHDSK